MRVTVGVGVTTLVRVRDCVLVGVCVADVDDVFVPVPVMDGVPVPDRVSVAVVDGVIEVVGEGVAESDGVEVSDGVVDGVWPA